MRGLLATYGALLSPRQFECAELHHVQDLSLSAIARAHQVSRQAIHDAVRHAEKALENIEKAIGMVGNQDIPPIELPSAKDAIIILAELRSRIAHHGIIYSSDWIIRDLDQAIHFLESPRHAGGNASN
jgi:predicted DNA-binding protein YlxM (UPF0122 family)